MNTISPPPAAAPSSFLSHFLSHSLSLCIVRDGLCIFLRVFESYYIPPSPLHSPRILFQGFFSIHQAAQSSGQNVPANHRYVHRCVFKKCHITFTLPVYCLTFMSAGYRPDDSQACDHDPSLRFTTGYFKGNLGTISSCACGDKTGYFDRKSGRLRPCLWLPKQAFKTKT